MQTETTISSAEILKFGGSSVANTEEIQNVLNVIQWHLQGLKGSEKRGLAIVVSAMVGVTNALYEAINNTRSGLPTGHLIEEVREKHLKVVAAIHGFNQDFNTEEVEFRIKRILDGVIGQIEYLKMIINDPRHKQFILPTIDFIASAGERLMAPILTAYLQASGIAAKTVDADSIFETDGRYDGALVNEVASLEKVKKIVLPELNEGKVVVVPGFYGVDERGNITTFGRNASDYSATELAFLLQQAGIKVEGVYLCKGSVAGVMSINPSLVEPGKAQKVSHLTYDLARSMGGRVVHPGSLDPATRGNIPVFCVGTQNPDQVGTTIDGNQVEADKDTRIISVTQNLAWLRISGPRMDVSGTMSQISAVLKEEGINIQLEQQPISQKEINFVFSLPEGKTAQVILEKTEELLKQAKAEGKIDHVSLTEKMAVVSVVGYGVNQMDSVGTIAQSMSTTQLPISLEPGIFQTVPLEASFLVKDEGDNVKNMARVLHAALVEKQLLAN